MTKSMVPLEGEPLTKEGLFMLVCDEVYKDGKVEDFELKILKTMAKVLKLPKEKATEGIHTAQERFTKGLFHQIN